MGSPSAALRLLGPVELLAGDAPVAMGGPVITALLVRLVAGGTGRPVPDDVLYEAVWDGEQWPDAPAGALRTSITRVRKAIEPLGLEIERIRDGYALHAVGLHLDLNDLEVLEREAHGSYGQPALDAATDALALWRGPSLTGIRQVPYGRELAAELDRRRSVLEDRWAELTLELGHPRRVIAFLERAVRADPTNELRWSLLAMARARTGHPREGLQAIETSRSQLVEVGLLPGPHLMAAETAILNELAQYEALDRHQHDLGPAKGEDQTDDGAGPVETLDASRVALAGLVPRRFVGRQEELERLTTTRLRVTGRQLSEVVVVSGEPGVGKSSLVAELCRLTSAVRVRFGWTPMYGGRPLEPIRPVLGEALDRDPAWRAGRVGRLLDDLLLARGDEEDLAELLGSGDVHMRRNLVVEACREGLSLVAGSEPLTLVVDDAQWADELTLDVVRSIARRPLAVPMLVVVTERSEGVLRTARSVIDVALGPLTVAEVGAWLDRPADDTWTARVMAETIGLPLLVEELLNLHEHQPVGAGGTDPVPRVTPSIQQRLGQRLLDDRLAGLPERTRATLAWGAVLGRRFRFDQLCVLTGRRELELLDDLDAAARVGIVVFDEAEPDILRFAHDLFTAALERSVTPLRLARMHADVVETLGVERLPAVVALHHARNSASFLPLESVDVVARRAGAELHHGLQFTELRVAMSWALERFGPSDQHAVGDWGAARARASIMLGRALAATDEPASARQAFEDAAAHARQAGEPTLVAEAVLVRSIFGRRFTDRGLLDELAGVLAPLPPDAHDIRFRVMCQLTVEAIGFGRFDLADAHLAELRTRQGLVDRPDAAIAVIRLEHWLAELRGRRAERLAAIDAFERIARQTDHHDVRARLLQARVIEALHAGTPEVAHSCALDLETLGRTGGSPLAEWLGLTMQFSAPFLRGEMDTAAERAEAARRRGQTLGVSGAFGAFASQSFALGWIRGDLAPYVDILRDLRVDGPDLVWRAALALALAETDAPDEAVEVLGSLAPQLRVPVTDWLGFVGTAVAAEAAFVVGHRSTLHAVTPVLAARRDDHVLLGAGAIDYGPALRYLGLALAGTGDRSGAEMLRAVAVDPTAGVVWRQKAERDLERLGEPAPAAPPSRR